MDEIERRYFAETPEVRATEEGGKLQLRGTGIVFNSWSEVMSSERGRFRERITPEAVEGLIDGADIRSFFNHDPSQVLGRTKSGTLRLTATKTGVGYELDLPDTTVGRDVHELTKRGDVDGSSFAFGVAENGDTWETRNNTRERTIHRMSKLLEMGPVSLPAYKGAKVSTRALEMAEVVEAEPRPATAMHHREHERLLLEEA